MSSETTKEQREILKKDAKVEELMAAGREKGTRVGGKSLGLPWKLGAISYQTFPLAPPSLFQFHLSITLSHPQFSPSPPFLRRSTFVTLATPSFLPPHPLIPPSFPAPPRLGLAPVFSSFFFFFNCGSD